MSLEERYVDMVLVNNQIVKEYNEPFKQYYEGLNVLHWIVRIDGPILISRHFMLFK